MVEFEEYRGGCIVCMDYGKYAIVPKTPTGFMTLRSQFKMIADILFGKLKQFEKQKFLPSSGHLMSHSYGSHLSFEAGRKFDGNLGGIDGKS